jgi:uncharacterized protein
LDGEPVEDVANTMFRRWGIGAKGKDEGVLLLLVTGDRKMRLEVGYGLEPILPDGFAGATLREMRPALRDGQYGDALASAARTIGTRIAEAKGVQIGTAPPAPRSRPRGVDFPWPLAIGGVFFLFWLFSAAGRRGRYYGRGGADVLPAILLGNMMSRSNWGGRGSGGFGGFDSGDSFGGFGGGDSGGGGASSNW